MNKIRILIVEDDEEIARLTALHLTKIGYVTSIVNDGSMALSVIKELKPDLILLDLMLPGVSGHTICKQARDFYHGPILIITASNDDMNEINLLEIGADDYLRKPVKPQLMSARIAALLRRSKIENTVSNKIVLKSITIDCQNHLVTYQGQLLNLTNAEYDMLVILAKGAGQIISRESCCLSLRGIDYDFTDRSIDMRIATLRKKLSIHANQQQLIKTVRNKGYILIDQ